MQMPGAGRRWKQRPFRLNEQKSQKSRNNRRLRPAPDEVEAETVPTKRAKLTEKSERPLLPGILPDRAGRNFSD